MAVCRPATTSPAKNLRRMVTFNFVFSQATAKATTGTYLRWRECQSASKQTQGVRCVSRVSDAALCIVDEYGTSIDSVLVLFGTSTSTALVPY